MSAWSRLPNAQDQLKHFTGCRVVQRNHVRSTPGAEVAETLARSSSIGWQPSSHNAAIQSRQGLVDVPPLTSLARVASRALLSPLLLALLRVKRTTTAFQQTTIA